ncbi:glycosyltransferase family 4 protein [Ancylobacter radicis]|uniref:Glycosyltransferase family 4 protein n=1 Tax=Ancylobacter radicis TaxID=2836179 RepID=A0ABS5RB97_9HYPH|nr:glycosyltransferase family 1 protein [Ancylobacter radicis]MBS9478926.1 glycosyltransferase family 4 protein [Ancylobacter radicis]
MKAVLDITRLLRRSGQHTPTGIDRVELAYARHLLESHEYEGRAAFVARLRATTWYLDASTVSAFIDTLALRWKLSEARVTKRELFAIERFLGQPTGSLANLEPPSTPRSALPDVLPPLRRLLSPLNLLPRLLRRRHADGAVYLNVSHEGLNSVSGVRSLARGQRMKPMFLVHDLIPLTHPEYVRPGDAEKHEMRMRTVLSSANAVVCNSRNTLNELNAFAERLRLSVPQTVVSPLGIEDEFQGGEMESVPTHPFFLTIGTIEPRKNHLVLLHAWRVLVEKLGPKAPKLIIVGRRGWENENVVDIIERCRKLGDHVLECNRLPDAHLRWLMRQSRAVLFPSFAEGFGLPLFEALALRVPVICSELEVFRDIAGDAPRYLDPIDGLGWARTIEEYASPNAEDRAAQLAKLARLSVPRWRDHFSVIDRLIDCVAEPSFKPSPKLASFPVSMPAPEPSVGRRTAPSFERSSSLIFAGERSLEPAGSTSFCTAQPHSSMR